MKNKKTHRKQMHSKNLSLPNNLLNISKYPPPLFIVKILHIWSKNKFI